MTAEDRLRWYARFFDAVEVNSSYYAIPAARNVLRWAERTPPGFVFHVKAYAPMTGHHPRVETLPDDVQAMLPARAPRTHRGEVTATSLPREALDAIFRHFRAALGPLEDAGKLGYVLFQFAPWVRYAPDRLAYLETLAARLPGARVAVEFRDRSWFPDHADETLAVLRRAGLGHVIVDAPVAGHVMPRVVARTASFAVFRLHGRNAEGWLRQVRGEEPAVREKYDYLYTDEELRALLPEIDGVAGEGGEVYISFNNNNRDYPVRNALMMKRLLGQPTAADPSPAAPRDLFDSL
ncbi:MAG: DUF72 domain-containing protein [Candidatus Rokubacteria bacterium]|nr:DUF72 domain-containing protein [Candidatus Rokubacteria bacterium]